LNRSDVKPSFAAAHTRVWVLWLLIGAATLVVFLTTLEIFPRVTQDGSQIIELGRVFLDPSTSWSANWLVKESQPLFPLSYIGSTIQELAYVAGAPSIMGPRLLAVVGALVATSFALAWMISRGTPPWAALFIALAFLLDPIFSSSYREGRVDSLAFAAILSACWLLRLALIRAENHQRIYWHTFFAGSLAGLSPFLWPTSLALLPLVLLEFFYLAKFFWQRTEENRFIYLRSIVAWFISGGIITVAFLLLPIFINWEYYPASLAEGARIQQIASVIKHSIIGMYAVHDPFIIPIILVSLLVRREPGLIVAIVLALIMMSQTMIYKMRILYLLPYLIAFVAGACAELSMRSDVQRRRMVLYSLLGFLLAFNISITLVKRPMVALHQKNARLPENITRSMEKAIGSGPQNVFTQEWDMYFAGRALGWNIYKIFGRISPGTPEFEAFLANMDWVILRTDFLFMKVSPDVLEKSGFELHTKISFPDPDDSAIELGPFSFRAPTPIYADVLIYGRK
jgi:hypothetical protein